MCNISSTNASRGKDCRAAEGEGANLVPEAGCEFHMNMEEQKSKAMAFRAMHRGRENPGASECLGCGERTDIRRGGVWRDCDHQCGSGFLAWGIRGQKISASEMLARVAGSRAR